MLHHPSQYDVCYCLSTCYEENPHGCFTAKVIHLMPGPYTAVLKPSERDPGRGVHLSTFQLNVSASRGIGGAFRGCLGGV
jgi:hypothetical protein